MSLAPPVEPMLARAVPRLPGLAALPGGSVFEPKYDGFRLLVFADADGRVFLQSRNGRDLTGAFPEIADAAAALGEDVVIDGEAVIYTGGRLDFSALQHRMNRRPRTVALLVREQPAHLVAFDLLQHTGTELLSWSYAERRAALESLFQGHGLQAPWALTPSTTDRALAEEWLTEWTAVGVEGLVIKGLEQTYQPGRRGWLKYRTRNTAEAVIGAVTGSVIRPETVLLGRYTTDGHFLLVARSTSLAPRLRAELGGGLLTPAGADHPWRDVHFTSHWGSRDPLAFTPVAPQLVAEFHGDTAVDRGRWRHPVNLHRLRIDLTPDDVPLYGAERPSADPDRPAAE
ncbi:ATP-dependent DNA ligase [Streptomyces lunaelactis]|uniref:ATP-dependent DNA ligase n=1 Tax=Streptomyces lunaelactis TaxID=1535768 RepID=UPI00158595D9|nr:ATP-dependent DNA ligase [Streptomyces lunaelactis]NUK25999.1 ATP-dependent DNA ligase [Streptomyces lunaelactis]